MIYLLDLFNSEMYVMQRMLKDTSLSLFSLWMGGRLESQFAFFE